MKRITENTRKNEKKVTLHR